MLAEPGKLWGRSPLCIFHINLPLVKLRQTTSVKLPDSVRLLYFFQFVSSVESEMDRMLLFLSVCHPSCGMMPYSSLRENYDFPEAFKHNKTAGCRTERQCTFSVCWIILWINLSLKDTYKNIVAMGSAIWPKRLLGNSHYCHFLLICLWN